MRAQKRRISAGWRKDWKMWKKCKEYIVKDKENRAMVAKHLHDFEEICEYGKMVKKTEGHTGDEEREMEREVLVPSSPLNGTIPNGTEPLRKCLLNKTAKGIIKDPVQLLHKPA
jgi:hypothetical protein